MKAKKIALLLLVFYLSLAININGMTPIISINNKTNIVFTVKQREYPILFVAKTADKAEVYTGDWFRVKIIVANIGNKTAYNITVIDSRYPSWLIQLRNYSRIYRIPEMESNTSIVLQYELQILKSVQENFSLGIVRLIYYDENSTKHEVQSQELVIKVRSKVYYVDKRTIYRQLTFALTLMIISAIVPLIIIERKVLLEYQKRK